MKIRPILIIMVLFLPGMFSVVIFSPFYRPVTEATKPSQQLSTPNSSGDINVTSLIAKLLTGYDKRLRPNFGGEENNFCLLIVLYRVCALLVIADIKSSRIPS